ncbi:MAG: hypothetical protein LBR80_07960 [Deltaproteobacteria bacterium]|jgi:hypothetical protein|nr:hypothetical protein [Deltaproteobacteria bacterium]
MDLVRPNDEIRVGGEIEAQCTKCGRPTTHRIVDMKKEGVPGKCECLACKSKHIYRKPVEPAADARSEPAKFKTVTRKKAPVSWPAAEAALKAKAPAKAAEAQVAEPMGPEAADAAPEAAPVKFPTARPPVVRPPVARPAKPPKKEAKPAAAITEEMLEDVVQAFAEDAEFAADMAEEDEDDDDLFADIPDIGGEDADSEDSDSEDVADPEIISDPYGMEARSAADDVAAKAAKGARAETLKATAAKGKAKEPAARPERKEAAKKPARPRAGAKADKGKGLEEAAALLKEWEEMSAAPQSKVVAYTLDGSYSAGQHLDHPAFGLGIVRAVIPPNKIRVNFRVGLKTLIMMVPLRAEPAS